MAEQQDQSGEVTTQVDTTLSPEAMIEEKRRADELLERRLSRLEEAAGQQGCSRLPDELPLVDARNDA